MQILLVSVGFASVAAAIDRQAVVNRHTVRVQASNYSEIHPEDVLVVGNGQFAFQVDITGTQTFNDTYSSGMASYDTNTMADWGWHSVPYAADDATYALRSFNYTFFDSTINGAGNTRPVPYAWGVDDPAGNPNGSVTNWIMSNPHRLNLGQTSLRLQLPGARATRTAGQTQATQAPQAQTQALDISTLSNAVQEQRMWEGVLSSNFTLSLASLPSPLSSKASVPPGAPTSPTAPQQPVSYDFQVLTAVHPQVDAVALRASCSPSSTMASDASHAAPPPCPLALRLAFPYSQGAWGPGASDWQTDDRHSSTLRSTGPTSATITRVLDSDGYRVDCSWASPGSSATATSYALVQVAPHAFDLVQTGTSSMGRGMLAAAGEAVAVELVCLYTPPSLAYPAGAWMEWLQAKANASAAYQTQGLPSFQQVLQASAAGWSDYWSSGAMVDLASGGGGGPDPRAVELERRVVLSQYLLRVHNAGAEPPAETGLLCNSWSGKHHLEMRFWHQAHWALWGRPDLLHRSDGFYVDLLPNATATATFQGYRGARWLKETATVANRSGIDVSWLGLDYAPFPFPTNATPYGPYGPLMLWESGQCDNAGIIWQQPHPIWLADAQRRVANATGGAAAALAVMAFQQELVFSTADFLSSFPYYNSTDGAYWIGGPPLFGAEEMGDGRTMRNPAFEMVQFAYALDVASEWREVLGLPAVSAWQEVSARMSRPPLDPGADPSVPTYTFNLACACVFNLSAPFCPPDRFHATQCQQQTSHPMMAGMVGMVNGRAQGDKYGVNATVLNNTVALMASSWGWGTPTVGTNVWGWDFPLVALAQARLGWDASAIADMLLLDVLKNSYLKNGHNYQSGGLPAYLPGNGGLLLAIAMLAAGSDTSPPGNFPASWGAQVEGFPIPYP